MSLIDRIRLAVRDVEGYPRPGIVFKDITPILADPALMNDIAAELAAPYRDRGIDAIAAIEARGFIFGSILASKLHCAFVPVRKAGKLPYHTRGESYSLEYGTAEIEVHTDAFKAGSKVLIHDDLLATGGTACAAARLVTSFGAVVSGFSFLINLGFLPGEANIVKEFGTNPDFLVKY